MTDRILVVGGGIAGLATALRLAPLPVTLIAGAPLATGAATGWAQGGIAAAIGDGDDPSFHAADTIKAGAGIGDPEIARLVTSQAPGAIDWLVALGAPFDRDASGGIALGLEAAHSRRRIVHASGDSTGRAVLETLIRAVRAAPSVDVIEQARVTDLVLDRDNRVAGIALVRGARRDFVPARAVVLATGGLGGLYAHTTNPLGAVGSGLAMAARAGVAMRDMEFVQFHPTAIDLGRDPMPLATEALRGEGAFLVNGRGERFMADIPGGELAPRDIVARAIWRELSLGEKVYLDARHVIRDRFPSVTAKCRDAGLDPAIGPIPVRPAAHYHMGGVKVDPRGRASLQGLWACGEVSSTGLHGANRLASNSLLEALVFARAIADDIRGAAAFGRSPPVALPPLSAEPRADPSTLRALRAGTEAGLGVIRDAEGIAGAIRDFDARARRPDSLRDPAIVGLLIAASAWSRPESRGGHHRRDFPAQRPEFAVSGEMTLEAAFALAATLAAPTAAVSRGR